MMSVMMGGADLHGQKKMRLLVHRVRLPKQPTGDARPLFSSVSGKSSFTEMAPKKSGTIKATRNVEARPRNRAGELQACRRACIRWC
jgi:hypothetical protein